MNMPSVNPCRVVPWALACSLSLALLGAPPIAQAQAPPAPAGAAASLSPDALVADSAKRMLTELDANRAMYAKDPAKLDSLVANVPSAIDSLMTTTPCGTQRPLPILMCPTSLLPMTPFGNPTGSPLAANSVILAASVMRFQCGVAAFVMALPGPGAAMPQPSRIARTRGREAELMNVGKPSRLRRRLE